MKLRIPVTGIVFLIIAAICVASTASAGFHEALQLMRTLNTLEASFQAEKHAYASQGEILAATGPELKDKITVSSREVLPGWTLDAAVVEKGYRLILTGKSDVLISDEIGVIYRAVAVQSAPRAAQLKSAKDFPGAIAYNLWVERKN